ncbi:esterase/lipase family protein [Actinomadura sp. 9N407]|uniref:esterase/lipase family protein n=1 Tax=Actinomadura sp. 9N407 TaxID=3375154 RepID=UPI0037ACB266
MGIHVPPPNENPRTEGGDRRGRPGSRLSIRLGVRLALAATAGLIVAAGTVALAGQVPQSAAPASATGDQAVRTVPDGTARKDATRHAGTTLDGVRANAPARQAAQPRAQAQGPVEDARRLATRNLRGANNWSCRPGAAHPQPVVLVHGMLSTGSVWSSLAPQLSQRGYCVFALDYSATIPVTRGVQQLSVFVDGVLAATGAEKVAFVGHSLGGGMVPHGYLTENAAKVSELVGIAPANQGQRIRDGVDYTVVASQYDGIVGTPEQQFLQGPAERVTNVRLQDRCAGNRASHLTIIFDRVAFQWVFSALDRQGPADPGLRPRC